MKKETIITAIVFFAIGCLVGYVGAEYKASNNQQAMVASGGGSSGPALADQGVTQTESLPRGHPPIGDTAVVKVLRDEAAERPEDPLPALKLANYFYDRQQFEQAIEWYQKVLALDPKNVSAHTDLGTSYFNVARPQEALREFRKSLQIDPGHAQTLFNVVVVNLEGTHDLAAAQQAWDRLHALSPSYPGLDRLKQSIDAARGPESEVQLQVGPNMNQGPLPGEQTTGPQSSVRVR
jgi:tetratricopeptide (TPR) repeat protein